MIETIFAQATPAGHGAVVVLRLSGPQAATALTTLTGKPPPAPRRATLVALRRPRDGELLDRSLALWFPAPASYTGEDVVELHLHGGRAVVAGVVGVLAELPGLRVAEPGEFTRRAFENGRMDLTEAEGVADLVGAETQAQRRQALNQMGGVLSRLYEGWRERLLHVLALLEAEIDFSDQDLPDEVTAPAWAEVRALIDELAAHLDDGGCGERLRDGISIAIIGPPNAGKSSLLNALARREVAIVSTRAGTTRDVIEVHLDLAGIPVTLADTAGLRETEDEIEAEGVRRARQRAAHADLTIAVFDGGVWPHLDPVTLALVESHASRTLAVVNKADLLAEGDGLGYKIAGRVAPAVSARTGIGLPEVLNHLKAMVAALVPAAAAAPVVTRARHRVAVEDCRAGLVRALTAPLPELAAEDVRLATRALGRITGRVDVEDILDAIFSGFCIGK
ncbi:tRNA modification GTPase MnmE [uncultured Gammaproteobacteria bacterium]